LKPGTRIYLGIALFVFVASSCYGFWYGKRAVEFWFKMSIMAAGHQATDYFKEGDIEQALVWAYRAKAFERERGNRDPLLSEELTDGLFGRPGANLVLGKIFLQKDQPCLSQGYLIDGFTHMDQEKQLAELPMYKETVELLLKIGKKCE
jgi:hypothetical protein